MICAVDAQRKAFAHRDTQIKQSDALQVREYEENRKVSDYAIGIGVRRVQNQTMKNQESENSDESDDEEETIGIKVIVSIVVSSRVIVTVTNLSLFTCLLEL